MCPYNIIENAFVTSYTYLYCNKCQQNYAILPFESGTAAYIFDRYHVTGRLNYLVRAQSPPYHPVQTWHITHGHFESWPLHFAQTTFHPGISYGREIFIKHLRTPPISIWKACFTTAQKLGLRFVTGASLLKNSIWLNVLGLWDISRGSNLNTSLPSTKRYLW